MNSVNFINSKSLSALDNLQLEQELLNNSTDSYIIFWQTEPTVVVGGHQIIENEVNVEYAQRHDIKVVQRKSGGGAVYMDQGNLNIAFIKNANTPQLQHSAKRICEFLATIGISAELSGRNDITVNELKVSGWAEQRHNGRSLTHGTLLVNVSLANMTNALTPSSSKLNRHGITSVTARVVNLNQYHPDMTIDSIKQKLSAYLKLD